MKKVAELKIFGHKLLIRSDENEEYIRAIEDYLNTKIEEVRENTKAVSSLDLALLAALNITGEVIKTKEILEKLGRKSEELSLKIDRRLV
ncbi:MAG: cell division protein ZapA [Deltaproteobacteria bacterium]|nr:cell division protein ZapA [Deltaproteobacteria bacterium]